MLTYLTQMTVFVTVTALFILVFKRLFKNKLSARWNVWIWALLLIRFLIPSLPQSELSVFNAVPVETVGKVAMPRAVQLEATEILITDNAGEVVYMESHPQLSEESTPEQKADLSSMWLTVWKCGAIALGVYFLAIYLVHIYRMSKCREVDDENTLAILAECREKLKIKRKIKVISGAGTPTLIGLFSPKILLPDGYTEDEKRNIMLHELCHLKHNDIFLIWVSAVVLCLNWFNPVIWYSFLVFRRDIEMYCDERVLRLTHSPKEYAILLLKTALKRNQFIMGTTSLQNGEKEVERRIKYIAYFKKPTIIWSIVVVAAAVCIGAVCLTNGVAKEDENKSAVLQEQPLGDDGIAKELAKDEKIRSVLPEGATTLVNSNYGFYLNVNKEHLSEAEKLADYTLGGKGKYRGFADNIGLDVLNYTDKEYQILINIAESAENDYIPYIYVFDYYTDDLVAWSDLKTKENEEVYRDILIRMERFSKAEVKTALYAMTGIYLEAEFTRVYTPYYEILSLEFTDWLENGNEAYFIYTMTHKNYDRDPDTVDYIKKAKESGDKNYEIYYNEYLQPKEVNYYLKVVLDERGNLNLYYNVAPKGQDYQPIKIDDFIAANWEE